MAHVIFVHGISNKPAPDALLRQWLAALAGDGGIDLPARGHSVDMVYWADVLYATPLPEATAQEAAGDPGPGSDISTEPEVPMAQDAEEALFLATLAAKVGGTLAAAEASASTSAAERVPLPWPVKKLFLKTFLRDVHHYLFDAESTPRPGETYRTRTEILGRYERALRAAPAGVPLIVVGHSLGTVIAYDGLVNLRNLPVAGAFLTIGSPLGLDEVQDKLAPGYSRQDGFPASVAGPWANIFDRLDPVAGFDPLLAGDFLKAGARTVRDTAVENAGAWRHSAVKYLAQPAFRGALAGMLG